MNKLTRSIAGLAAGILISQSALATHFRGGQIAWLPADLDGDGQSNDITVTVTSYWRSDFVEDIELSIKPVLTITPVADDTRFVGGAQTAADSDYAIRTQTYEVRDLSLLRPYTLVFDGGDRISTLFNNADAKWALQSTAYLAGGNVPPEINFPIYAQVPQEDADGNVLESWTLDASVPDANGHTVRYRLANISELGGRPTFTNPTGLSVDESTGLVTWQGSGSLEPGLYSGGIVAEDFDAQDRRISRTHRDFVLSLGTPASPGPELPPDDGHHHGSGPDETPAGDRDTDGDGVRDGIDRDSDNDGLPDVLEAPGIVIPGGENDEDGDGIDDSVDVDITGGDDLDGNGIDDTLEADTDGDGVPDRLDLDSDNDGIPDVIELFDPAQPDADFDGFPDNFQDDNGDGLHDGIPDNVVPVDTDGDGIPDYLDLDSDNDGISDLIEGGADPALDANDDGMIDDLIDVDKDGIADGVDGHIHDFAPGIPASLPDSDADGIYDFRDPVSNGQEPGEPTGGEGEGEGEGEGKGDGSGDNGGTDGNGTGNNGGTGGDGSDGNGDGNGGNETPGSESPGNESPEVPQEEPQAPAEPDAGAETPRLRTAVKGGGALDTWALLLMGGLFAAARGTAATRRRLPRMKRLAVAVPVVLAHGVAGQAFAQDVAGCSADKGNSNCWYVGGGIGVSQLDPEGSSNGWATDDDQDAGFELHIGQHFRPHWFWELSYAVPGEASLKHPDAAIMAAAPNAAIEYKIPSLTVGYYLWENSHGWNLYGKAGVSAIDTKSNFGGVEVDEESSAQLVLGAGVQYHFNNTPWFARLEFNHFDRDARFVALKLSRAFGYKPAARTAKADDIAVIPADNASTLREAAGACPDTPPTLVVSEKECAVLNDVIHGVHFATDSIELSLDAANHLLDAAALLKANSDRRVEVQAHTDDMGEDEYNLWLSEQRAEAVKDFLIEQGVNEEQIEAKGYGEADPVAPNDNAKGRARNRRVEFRLLD